MGQPPTGHMRLSDWPAIALTFGIGLTTGGPVTLNQAEWRSWPTSLVAVHS